MQKENLRHKKLAKKRKRRKDCKRRQNINKQSTQKDEDGNTLELIQMPKSKKYKMKKSEIKRRIQASKNIIQTASGS